MFIFSRPLGDAVKRARGRLGLTQAQVAETVGIDSRTVMNIENYKGNPKLEVLFPLLRALNIDAREVFNPELQRDSPEIMELRLLVEECSPDEAKVIVPVVNAVLAVLRESEATEIK